MLLPTGCLNDSFRKTFSSNLVSVSCFILAILFKIALTYYFLQFDTDKIHQASAAKNFVEGHGLTIKQVHVSDLSRETYEPLSGWPPGYSLLVAFFYSFLKDLELSCFIIDILAIVLFFIVLRKLLLEFDFPVWLINLLMLFNGLIITDSIILGAPTDLLALVCCLWACFLAISAFKNNTNSVGFTIAIGLLNVLPALLRYMYIPSTFVVPLFFIYTGMRGNKSLIRTGTITLIMAVVLLSISAMFQYFYAGSAIYILPTERGIFWSNLLWLYPVLFSTFINLNFWCVQLSFRTGISYATWVTIFRAITIPVLVYLMFLFLKRSFKIKFIENASWNAFLIIQGFIGLSIVLVLGYLSLTHSRHIPLPFLQYWTYIGDGRYFIGIALFLLIVTARWLFMIPHRRSMLKRFLQYLFTFLLAADVLHGIYFLAKNFTLDRRNNKPEVLQERLLNFLKAAIIENRGYDRDVIVANYTYLVNRSVLLGEKGLFNPTELNNSKIYSSKPALLIVPLESFQFSYYKPFLSKKGVQLRTKIDKYYIYYYYIMANDRN